MKVRAVALVALLSVSGCGLFTTKEPYERWKISVAYLVEGGRVVPDPDHLEIRGPRGEIRVSNTTPVRRGFKVDGLGIAAEIRSRASRRFSVTGFEDGKTYTFLDHLHRDGPRGTIVVRYVRQD
jgi:hypothetical protein